MAHGLKRGAEGILHPALLKSHLLPHAGTASSPIPISQEVPRQLSPRDDLCFLQQRNLGSFSAGDRQGYKRPPRPQTLFRAEATDLFPVAVGDSWGERYFSVSYPLDRDRGLEGNRI